MAKVQKLTPCLLFQGNATEAARYYVKIFKHSKILHSDPIATQFQIEGQRFLALNGPEAAFTWAISFMINCKTQREVDSYWKKLKAGGEEQPCGWVKDKFGVSWQVVPEGMMKLVLDKKHPEKAGRAMSAMLKMKKLDLNAIKKAYAGR